MRPLGESITVGPEMGAKMCVGSSSHSERSKQASLYLPTRLFIAYLFGQDAHTHRMLCQSYMFMHKQTDVAVTRNCIPERSG